MNEPQKLSRSEQLFNRYKDEVKREKVKARKLADGQKIVLGGCLIAAMRDDPALRDQVGKLVDKYVTKPGDRTRVEQWLPQRQA